MPNWISSIWGLCAGQRRRYGAAIVALIFASAFLYLVPLVPQIAIDGVIAPDAGTTSNFVKKSVDRLGGRDFLAANLWLPALLVAGLTALAAVFTYLRGRWSAQASETIARTVRDRVYDHLQHLPSAYFDTATTGDLIQRSTSDVETLRVFLATQVVEIGRAAVMLLLPIPLMLAIDVRMTIASVILIPVLLAFCFVFFSRVRAAFKAMDQAEGRMTTVVQENLTGIRVVRAFARQEFEREKLDDAASDFRNCDANLYRILARFWSISDFICFLQKATVIGAGAYWLGNGTLQVGAFFYFLTAVSLFIWPVRMMGRILADLGKAIVATERLQEILDAPREQDPEAPASMTLPFRGTIEFENVVFSHGEESPALDRVSFTIPAGGTLALLGPSGCGKSTIVSLLLRLYDLDAGTIRLDGHDIAKLPRKLVRSSAAVVMQEPFLYSKTLGENIKIGRPNAAEEEMVEAATIAAVHEAIQAFEDGYETTVGERGVTLSGGQRQRVALARALLAEPAVLVLDDALSAVDAETEELILDALRRRHGKHTSIVIAHRVSSLMHADTVVVLDHGRIVQCGSHRELVAQEGLYQRLWRIQNSVADEPTPRSTTAGAEA